MLKLLILQFQFWKILGSGDMLNQTPISQTAATVLAYDRVLFAIVDH